MLKKRLIRTFLSALLFTLTVTAPASADIDLGITNILFIVPGMTRTIDISQTRLFPLGCPNYLIMVVGQGTLGLSVKKEDVEGDTIFMTGMAVSDAGDTPFFRIGASNGMIDQLLDIGTEDKPYGLVWVYCGIAFSRDVPLYNFEFRYSLSE